MSDRLAELRHQRQLMQEHLAWLDREIAAAEASRSGPLASSPPPAASPAPLELPAPRSTSLAVPSRPSAVAPAHADAEAILAQYRTEPRALHTHIRKGCFLYFGLALALLALSVLGLYYALRHE